MGFLLFEIVSFFAEKKIKFANKFFFIEKGNVGETKISM